MTTEEVMMVSGFYKNGGDGGFGISLRGDNESLVADLEAIKKTARSLRSMNNPGLILSTLAMYATHKSDLDHGDKVEALGWVLAAEAMGLLKADDYNGLLVSSIVEHTMVNDMTLAERL